MAQFVYSGNGYTFNSGVFLCTDTGTQSAPGTQSNPALLQYGQANKIGVIDDVTPVAALTRVFLEVGTLFVPAVTLSYDLPPGPLVNGIGGTMTALQIKAALLAMAQAQHNGALTRYQDTEGNNWLGGLILKEDSFERQPGGGVKIDVSFVEVS